LRRVSRGKKETEAARFGDQDNEARRELVWSAIPHFRDRINAGLDLGVTVKQRLAGRERPVALTLACGDMAGEYTFLKRMGVAEIDAFDLSEGQREKFRSNVDDGAVPVNYQIADVNNIELAPGRYDVVYLQHAYHHVERLEHVADQIRAALKPDGTLALIDYVGANFLQRTPRQRDLCAAIWRTMPERYRVRPSGRVFAEMRIPDRATLSPYEAVRSEEIISVLDSRFDRPQSYFFGGILFPIFNGVAQNFTDSETDQDFLRVMWDLDRWLLETGSIEPNFVKAIYTPRP
jgi:SAM-dependent methyltransferase